MKNKYFELYSAFFKIGAVTFGGGIAMLPVLSDELIKKRAWITDNELLDYYAVGQSTPGIIAVNVATFVGFKRGGILGGILATLGVITPSVLIILILANLIDSIEQFPIVQKALKGINVAVCALVLDATTNFAKKSVKGILSFCLLAASFCLIFFFNVPSYFIILGSGFLGAVVYFIKRKIQKSKQIEKVEEKNDRN